MTYTVAEALSQARKILNDNDATVGYRKDDAHYITLLNEGLGALALVRPELFETTDPLTTQVGAFQRLRSGGPNNIRSIRFQGCDRNAQGYAMTRFDKRAMDQYNSAWPQGTTTANVRQWCEHETIPDAFWVYPPATASSTIYVDHIADPAVLPTNTTATVLPTPDAYLAALVDYIAYRESSSDDENVIAQRAVAFFQQYLGEGGVASRQPMPGAS